jgi:hypothetical protein
MLIALVPCLRENGYMYYLLFLYPLCSGFGSFVAFSSFLSALLRSAASEMPRAVLLPIAVDLPSPRESVLAVGSFRLLHCFPHAPHPWPTWPASEGVYGRIRYLLNYDSAHPWCLVRWRDRMCPIYANQSMMFLC